MSVANNIQYSICIRSSYYGHGIYIIACTLKMLKKCEEMIEIIRIHPCKINKKISMAFNKFKFYFRKCGMVYTVL